MASSSTSDDFLGLALALAFLITGFSSSSASLPLALAFFFLGLSSFFALPLPFVFVALLASAISPLASEAVSAPDSDESLSVGDPASDSET